MKGNGETNHLSTNYQFMKQANPKKNTHRYCTKCNHKVQYERILDYPFYCPRCDENMYNFETYRRK